MSVNCLATFIQIAMMDLYDHFNSQKYFTKTKSHCLKQLPFCLEVVPNAGPSSPSYIPNHLFLPTVPILSNPKSEKSCYDKSQHDN